MKFIEMVVLLLVSTFHSMFLINSFKIEAQSPNHMMDAMSSLSLMRPLLKTYYMLESAIFSTVTSDSLKMPPHLP